jgi:hypothetical protein
MEYVNARRNERQTDRTTNTGTRSDGIVKAGTNNDRLF